MDKANLTDSSDPGLMCKYSGAASKWYRGSETPQNNIPVAIVVHKVIVNQFQRFNKGFACSPPIFNFPKGLKK